MVLTQKQIAQREIVLINSKPRLFSQQQTEQLTNLNQEVNELKKHLKELAENPYLQPKFDLTTEDEQEINNNGYSSEKEKQELKRTQPINKRISELNEQFNSIYSTVYNPEFDGQQLNYWNKILNPTPLKQQAEIDKIEEEERIEKELAEKTNPTDEQLTEWKNTGKIKDFQGTRLNLSEKASFGWGITELTIENCPKLRKVNLKRFSQTNQADEVQERWMGSHNEQRTEFNGQLSELTIKNCPQLQEFDASCNNLNNQGLNIEEVNRNKLTNLDLHNNKQITVFNAVLYPNLEILNLDHCNLDGVVLTGLTELKNFSASGNQLTELNLDDNTKLVNLVVNNNKLRKLKVNHLGNLERLACFENNLTELDCGSLDKLKELLCAKNARNDKEIRDEFDIPRRTFLRSIRKDQEIFDETIAKAKAIFDETIAKANEDYFSDEDEDYFSDEDEDYFSDEDEEIVEAKRIYDEEIVEAKRIYDEEIVEAKKVFNEEIVEAKKVFNEEIKRIKEKQNFWNLNIDGCENIEILDIDCNFIKKTNFSNFLKLEQLSLMYNGSIKVFKIHKILPNATLFFSNLPNLIYFNYYCSNITKVIIKDCPKLIQGGNTIITENTPPSEFLNPQGKCQIVNNASASESVRQGHDDSMWGELIVERQEKQLAKKVMGENYHDNRENPQKKKKNEPVITDPAQLKTSFRNLKDEFGQESEVNLAGGLSKNRALTGTMIIDGWQADFIDVGNNFLHYLQVKNCRNLTKLIYAHNAMRHDAWIDWASCPNLKPENVHKEKYNDSSWDAEMEEKFQKGELTSNEDFNRELSAKKRLNNKVKNLLAKLAKGETNAWQEFINAFQGQNFEFVFADLNQDCQAQFTKIFVPRLNSHVQDLIKNHRQDQSYFLAEVEKILPFRAYLSDELKNQLTQLVQSEINPTKNYWPLIIGSIIILISLGLLLLLINKTINKYLTFNKFQAKKKRVISI